MIPTYVPTSAVQKESFSLAGMITFDKVSSLNGIANLLSIVKVFSPSAPVRMYTNVNVFGLSKIAEMFTNLGVFSLPKTNDNATNIDVRNLSKPDIHLAKNSAEWLSKVVIETAPAGLHATVRTVEADLHKGYSYEYARTSERALDTRLSAVITVLNECRLTVIQVSNEARLGVIARVTGTKKGSTSNATPLITADSYQPFGSMPRLSSSRLNKRFIQPERLSSPSSCMAIDSRSYSSASKRSWTANRAFLLSLVDILNHRHVSFFQVDNVYQRQQKQNPVSADTPTGLLTTTVILSNEEAVLNNITPQQVRHSHTLNTGTELPSFIWIIAAVRRDCQSITAQIHHIEAESEREARRSLAREHVTFFAGRIRKGAVHA